jgi:hypothetical protein
MSDTPYFDAYMRGERSNSHKWKIANIQYLEYMKLFSKIRYERERFNNPCREVFLSDDDFVLIDR